MRGRENRRGWKLLRLTSRSCERRERQRLMGLVVRSASHSLSLALKADATNPSPRLIRAHLRRDSRFDRQALDEISQGLDRSLDMPCRMVLRVWVHFEPSVWERLKID